MENSDAAYTLGKYTNVECTCIQPGKGDACPHPPSAKDVLKCLKLSWENLHIIPRDIYVYYYGCNYMACDPDIACISYIIENIKYPIMHSNN